MNARVYESDQERAELIDPIDVDVVAVVGCDWSLWLASISVSALDESSFSISSGLEIGDGVVSVLKGGYTVTPPSPTLSSGITAAHVWTGTTTTDGDEVRVTNTVRAGSRVAQRSMRMKVVAR